jgi:hypothetical protein
MSDAQLAAEFEERARSLQVKYRQLLPLPTHDARYWRKTEFNWMGASLTHGRPELKVEVFFLVASDSEKVERIALTPDIAYLFTTDRYTGQAHTQTQVDRRDAAEALSQCARTPFAHPRCLFFCCLSVGVCMVSPLFCSADDLSTCMRPRPPVCGHV